MRPRPSITIQTRQGNSIPYEHGYELPQVNIDKFLGAFGRKYPNPRTVSLRKMPTGLYNCHGMTFFCRRGRVIDDAAISLVLQDDGFSEVAPDKVLAGDVILYLTHDNDIDHSGIVAYVDTGMVVVPWVLSKWGDAGEYLHRFNVCPYYEANPRVRYMRES